MGMYEKEKAKEFLLSVKSLLHFQVGSFDFSY